MNWKELQQWLFEHDERENAGNGIVKIEITQQHIDLIRRYWINWYWTNEPEGYFCGVPNIGLYRPYGNSDVLSDIAEILDIKQPNWDADENWTDNQLKEIALLHRGAGYALEIMLQHGQLAPGTYTSTNYTHEWHPAKKEQS